jgi:hypothetical protein
MNIKSLIILAIMAAVLVFAALSLHKTPERQGESAYYQQAVFASLAAHIDQITEIHLQRHDSRIHLRKEGAQWQVHDKGGYAADLEKIAKLLLGVADVRYLEQKTRTPELYAQLDVQDIDQPDSAAVHITLKDSHANVMADFLVGKQKTARLDNTRQEIYLRKVGDAQTWLVLGNIPIMYEKNPQDWLQRTVFNIDSTQIKSVDITHNDEHLHIFKPDNNATEFSVAEIGADNEISNQFALNNIANSFANLSLDDVRRLSEFDFIIHSRAIAHTFDGLEITLERSHADDGRYYVRMRAAFSADSSAEVQQQAHTLNAQWQEWAFVLPTFKLDNIFKARADVIGPRAVASQESGTELPSSIDAHAHSTTVEESGTELPSSIDAHAHSNTVE